ncbi:MAG: RnfABCDGE type electron transport complex subunit D, partial [Sphingobacteriales bacterium]|nr:RnfABCDGE type electron transport complex subunit D [Sphingobacteriales bacterium]
MNKYVVSLSPHIHGREDVRKIMWGVVYAMIPALLVSIYFFGLDSVRVTLISVASCLLVEYLIQRFFLKGKISITDGSAVITGILLAFNVPANLPNWIIVVGAIVAIGIAKMSFGGLGKNPFNPALVGRVFLLIAFPVQMTSWPKPHALFSDGVVDAITGATPLGILKEGLKNGMSVDQIMQSGEMPRYVDMMLGNMGGSLGEMSAIALLIGAIYMFWKKIITWHIPVSYLGSALAFALIFWLIDPVHYVNPLFHLVTGGLMLGVFFMATDMVSSPMTPVGMIVYGIGCGVLTMLIRLFGAYPEG